MVKVTFILNKTEYIGLIVEGHANFAEYGKDMIFSPDLSKLDTLIPSSAIDWSSNVHPSE